jgi:hypothetical protein
MFDAVELVFGCDRRVPRVSRETLVDYTPRYLQEHGLDFVFDEHTRQGRTSLMRVKHEIPHDVGEFPVGHSICACDEVLAASQLLFLSIQSTAIQFVTRMWILASIRHCTLSSGATANRLAKGNPLARDFLE